MINYIEPSQWIWQGVAGHFIAGNKCQFRLNTIIGKYLISTIGDYYSHGERHAIGCDRFYETMVFPYIPCKCGCGLYDAIVDDGPLYFAGYNKIAEAQSGHYRICEMAARGEFNSKENAE